MGRNCKMVQLAFELVQVQEGLNRAGKHPKVSTSICLQTTPGHKMSQVCMEYKIYMPKNEEACAETT
jgi:hypothetical protein